MSKTKERIHDSNLRYKQGLGQNFIYDEDLLAALVASSEITKDDDVLEIGPGAGSMTKYLCDAAHHVLSIELDERLIPLLTAFLAERDNFTLVQGDVMTLNLADVTKDLRKPLSVVANIPYYITTPLLTMLLGQPDSDSADGADGAEGSGGQGAGAAGDDGWGMLSVRSQFYCDPYLAMDVPAKCFTPVPKVDSAFIVLPWRETPAVQVQEEADFFRVAQAAFALRRKTMTNGLCAAFHMERADAVSLMQTAGLDERIRGEKLTLAEFARLADAFTAWKAKQA